jgi:UDP-N-acetylglucosamine 2-epimerase (non-hydrolysing)
LVSTINVLCLILNQDDFKVKKILIVFGTRPEAIKMAPVVKEFQKHPEQFETVICVTAQHREMLDQVLRIFDIVPDIDLNIMKSGQDLTDVTTRVLSGMRDVLKDIKPDIVLVHGDTSTSSATALAAFYQKITVGHIEAGLRTHNIYKPWPEEINRQITGRIATWHFTPTALTKKNLLDEGVAENNILVTGNTVIDALHISLKKIRNNSAIVEKIEQDLIQKGLPLNLINSWKGNEGDRKMILITGHRRENFGEGFINICEAIRDLSFTHPYVDFVYPMHLNPNVREPVQKILGETVITNIVSHIDTNQNIFLIEPLEYLTFIYLMQKCTLVLTDSGGIQEEAPGLCKPVLVMRNETERPEGITAGTVRLIGTNKEMIISEVEHLLKDQDYYETMSLAVNPYGDGTAAEKIVGSLI